MTIELDLVRQLGAANGGLAVVSTTRPDGSVHSSLVSAGVLADPVTGEESVGIVVRGDSRKLALLRGNGHATVTFHQGYQWVSVDGPVRIAGPDDPVDGVEIPGLLRAVFQAAGGTHDNWDEYDRVMAAENRTAVLVQPARLITN